MLPNIVVWMILGLVAGTIAKFIMPGRDPGGFFVTIGIGIAGSFVGGYVGDALELGTRTGGLSLPSVATAVLGSLILLTLFRAFNGKRG